MASEEGEQAGGHAVRIFPLEQVGGAFDLELREDRTHFSKAGSLAIMAAGLGEEILPTNDPARAR